MKERYCRDSAERFIVAMETGRTMRTTIAPNPPVMRDSRTNRPPLRSACASSPAPIALPSMMAAAAATPKPTTCASWRTTWATELAATAVLPRWPMITEFIELPRPHISSFIVTGMENLRKSWKSKWSRTNRSLMRNRTT